MLFWGVVVGFVGFCDMVWFMRFGFVFPLLVGCYIFVTGALVFRFVW